MKYHILFIIILVLLSPSCSHKPDYPLAMQQAIHCMKQSPDSARLYLASLDSIIMQEPEETRMYHLLLKIKAGGRKELANVSDSLMARVVDYYEHQEGEDEKLLMAYYYLGRIYRNMGDSPNSLVVFQKAAEIGERLQRYDMLGRIYEQINYIYAFQGLYSEALEMIPKAKYNYLVDGDMEGVMFACRNKARIFDRIGEKDSLVTYYQQAYEIAFVIGETAQGHILNEYISVCAEHGLARKTEELLNQFPAELIEKDRLVLKAQGLLHFYNHRYDLAICCFQKAIQLKPHIYDDCDIYKLLSEIKEKTGDYQQAYHYARKSLALKDSIANITKTEAVDRVRSLYNYNHIQKQNRRLQLDDARNEKFIYMFILISWTLLTLLVSLYFYYRRHKKMSSKREAYLLQLKKEQEQNSLATLEQNQRQIDDLTAQLQLAESRNEQIRQQLQSQKEALEMSNRKIQLNLDGKTLSDQVLIKSEIAQWFTQERNWEVLPQSSVKWLELEKEIEQCFPNFISQLRFLYPNMSLQEWHTCLLVKLKIPVKGMAKLLSCTKSSVSNIRSRLYKKIFKEEGGAESFDKFIADL